MLICDNLRYLESNLDLDTSGAESGKLWWQDRMEEAAQRSVENCRVEDPRVS